MTEKRITRYSRRYAGVVTLRAAVICPVVVSNTAAWGRFEGFIAH